MGKFIDCLIEELHSGPLDPQRAKGIESLLRLRSEIAEVSSNGAGDAPPPPGATYVEAYEASWLREKKEKWAEECEKKYADQFPKRGD